MRPLHLSATQLNMYLRCPRQYYFRYIEGIKVPPAGAMIQGRAGHAAVERNYRQKIESTVDLPVDELTDFFAENFEDAVKTEEPVLDEGQTVGGLKDEGVLLVREHRKVLAPTVQPVEVEQKIHVDFHVEDFEYSLMGILDVVDAEHFIRDNKFKMLRPGSPDGKRKAKSPTLPSADELAKDIQLSTYSLAYRMRERRDKGDLAQAEAGLKLDVTMNTTKGVKAVTLPVERSRETLALHLNSIGHVAKGIKAESFPTKPDGWHCSKRFCGYWDRCMGKGLITVDLGESNGQSDV